MKVTELTELLGLSKQSYYKRKKLEEAKDIRESLVLSLVKEKRKLWKKGSGRNLHSSLQEEFKNHNVKLGRDKFFELLRENGLLVKKNQRRTRTTFSYHHFHKYPNLIKDLTVERVNQVIVTDITYLYLRDSDSFAYLFLVTDLFSRKILGYKVSDNLSATSAVEALLMAMNNMTDIDNTIHHSDRGIQYCSNVYAQILKSNKIGISMTEENHCYENAMAERVNGILKDEFYLDQTFTNVAHAKRATKNAIKLYNEIRLHLSLNFKTPNMVYKLTA